MSFRKPAAVARRKSSSVAYRDGTVAGITHRRAQTADKLMQNSAGGALYGTLPSIPSGQFQAVLHFLLEIAVADPCAIALSEPIRGMICTTAPDTKNLAGAFSVPAKEPTITQSAPAATALATSPESLMPPSAMQGTSPLRQASADSSTAENWERQPRYSAGRTDGTRPNADFYCVRAGIDQRLAPSGVAIFPAITWVLFDSRLIWRRHPDPA